MDNLPAVSWIKHVKTGENMKKTFIMTAILASLVGGSFLAANPYAGQKVTNFVNGNPAHAEARNASEGAGFFGPNDYKKICSDLKDAANVVNAEGKCRANSSGNIFGLVSKCCALGGKPQIMNCIHNFHNVNFNCNNK